MEKNITFDEIEVQKLKFNQHKGPISVTNMDLKK